MRHGGRGDSSKKGKKNLNPRPKRDLSLPARIPQRKGKVYGMRQFPRQIEERTKYSVDEVWG